MIKIKFNKTIVYFAAIFIFSNCRSIIKIILSTNYGFSPKFIYLFLMNLGQITGGLTLYSCQYKWFKKKKKTNSDSKDIELIHNEMTLERHDNIIKIIILIFFAAIFDFEEFIIAVFYTSIINISPSFSSRLGYASLIASSLISQYALKIRSGKHHKYAIIFLGVFLFVRVIIDLLYKPDDLSIGHFFLAFILSIFYSVFISFTDTTERYIADVNFLNPFRLIMIEGIIEIIISVIYSIGKDPFRDIKIQYEKNSTETFILILFFLFLYLLLSAALNAYKVYINAVFSPFHRTLMDYFINPFFNIYYFVHMGDFNENYFYFFISEIFDIIMIFVCGIHNEYIVIYYCGLEHDTDYEITRRALKEEMKLIYKLENIDVDEKTKKKNNSENSSLIS